MAEPENPKIKPSCSWRYLRHAFIRAKPLDQSTMLETPLDRSLSQLDILMYGLGAMIGNSIYGVIAVVARQFTGPSTFISFILAGIAALLNGFCYAELSAHIPRAGSAYAYTYVIGGELLAFITGWLMLLEYAITACSAAVSAAYNLDILSNGTISHFILTYIGRFENNNMGMINEYPNLPAFLICVIAMIVLSTGNQVTSLTNIILTTFTLIVVAIATGYMYAFFNEKNFLSPQHDSFFPFGAAGLLSGAGIAFNAYIGFDAISVAGEEAKNPRQTIPRAIMYAVVIVIVVCAVHSIAFVGYTPWWHVNPQLGLAEVFYHPPVEWLRILVSAGALVAAMCSVICCTFAIPRIAYSMAVDGLIFSWMGWIHPKTKVPLIPLYIFGSMTAVVAIFFNYASLVSFLSIGTLISYVIVAGDLIMLRFMKPHLYNTKNCEEVGHLYQPFRTIDVLVSTTRGLVPCTAAFIFTVLISLLILFALGAATFIGDDKSWAVFLISLLVLGVITCVALAVLHRPYLKPKESDRFEVPLVPICPLLCIFFNITLIIKLPVLTWIRIVLWLAIGFMIYFGYGIWKSKLNNPTKPQSTEYSDIPGNNGSVVGKETPTVTEESEKDEKSPIMSNKVN